MTHYSHFGLLNPTRLLSLMGGGHVGVEISSDKPVKPVLVNALMPAHPPHPPDPPGRKVPWLTPAPASTCCPPSYLLLVSSKQTGFLPPTRINYLD